MTKQTQGLLLASTTALFWGVLAIALKVGLQSWDSITIVWFRFSFAFAFLFLSFLIIDRRKLAILKNPPKQALLGGLCLGLNYFAFMKSLEYTTPSITQIIIQIGPMSLALMGVLYFKEKLGKRQLTGFALAGIGFFLFYRDQLAQHLELADLNLGVIWVLFAAFTWVIYATAQKTISDKYNAQELNLIIYGVAAIMFVFFADFSIVPTLPSDEWPLMIFLAMNTIIAYGCLGAAFNKVEANKISIIITLNPLITIIGMNFLAYLGVKWIAPEKITWQGYLGASLVITGALFVTVFRKKSLEKTPPLAHHQAHDENNEVQA